MYFFNSILSGVFFLFFVVIYLDVPGFPEALCSVHSKITWILLPFFAIGVSSTDIWYYPSQKKDKNKTAVLVIPGGGYYGLWFDHEGVKVAKWLNEQGISAFVLKHRVPHWESEDCRSKVALSDAQRSIRIIRANSKKWGINPDKIGVLGFSAGGHLASTLSTHHDNGLNESELEIDKISSRPDFSILVYPVITMQDTPYTNMGTRENLLGKCLQKIY